MRKVTNILIATMFSESLDTNFNFFGATAKFMERFGVFESTTPQMPIPPGQPAPPDIPRYILQTEEGKYSFSFSGSRFDFRFNEIKHFDIEYLDQQISVITSVLKSIKLKPFRLGIVLDGFVEIPNKREFLEDYISEKVLDSSQEYQVSFRNVFEDFGHSFNTWTRFAGSGDDSPIIFQFDINTLAPIDGVMMGDIYKDTISKKIGEFIVK